MKKTIFINMILAMMLAMSFSLYAEDVYDTEMDTEMVSEESVKNTVDWDNFHISIGEKEMSFPTPVSDILDAGWEAEDMDAFNAMEIEPLDYGYFYGMNGDDGAYFHIANESFERMPAPGCYIAGIDIDSYDFNLENTPVTIMDSIAVGTDTIDSVREIFGEEDLSYEEEDDEGSSMMAYQYSDGGFRVLVLYTDMESDIINGFQYSDTSMSDEMESDVEASPNASVTDYKKPEAVGETFEDYRINLDGNTYTLPVPVMTLVGDGWEVEEDTLNSIVSPGYAKMIHFSKGEYNFESYAYNDTDKATPVINCWVGEIELGGYADEVVAPWEIPAGIKEGMTREELVATLDKLGMHEDPEEAVDNMTYIVDSSDNWDDEGFDTEFDESEFEEVEAADKYDEYYVYSEDWNRMYSIKVFTGNNPNFTKESVIGVSVINYPNEIYDNMFGLEE